MVGYIIKHSHLGIGKVLSQQTNTVLVKFITGQELPFGPSAFNTGSITHARLDIGNRCLGQRGECKIIRVARDSRNDSPYQYEVIYNDGLSAVVSELELTPLSLEDESDPLLQLASLSPQSYSIFKTREQLVEALARTLREGSGLRALLSSRIDLRPHQAFVAGVVMLWLATPPSDHDANVYVVPPDVCGVVAPIVRIIPTTASSVSGVVSGCPSRFNWRPEGLLASVNTTLRGRMSRWVVCVSPPESRTVR